MLFYIMEGFILIFHLRLYYEWLPLAFIAKTLGGEFLIIGEEQTPERIRTIENSDLLTKEKIRNIHSISCGGLLGSKKAVNWIKDKNLSLL